jgi:hypothetical protein
MKHLIIIVILLYTSYAVSSDKQTLSFDTNSTLSSKEISFQKYIDKREKENKKLEDDGFCSCGN